MKFESVTRLALSIVLALIPNASAAQERVLSSDLAEVFLYCERHDDGFDLRTVLATGRYELREITIGHIFSQQDSGASHLQAHALFFGGFCHYLILSNSALTVDWVGSILGPDLGQSVIFGDYEYTVPFTEAEYGHVIQYYLSECEERVRSPAPWPYDPFQSCSQQVQDLLVGELIVVQVGGSAGDTVFFIRGTPFFADIPWER